MDDATLTARLMADAPPARDLAFTLAVLARIEKQQYRRALLTNIALAAGSILLLALAPPQLAGLWQTNIAPLGGGTSNMVIAVLLLAAVVLSPQLLAQQD
jgi:hypothetical protein